MSILSDQHIFDSVRQGDLHITPFDPKRVQPASYDVCLADKLLQFYWPTVADTTMDDTIIDPLVEQKMEQLPIPEDGFILWSGHFVLGSTVEKFTFPANIAGRLDGKSSLGRLGLSIHTTAGFFDPGFRGTATLEIHNMSPRPIRLRPGMEIGQMSFWLMSSAAKRPYGHPERNSKYQDQGDPKASEYYLNRDVVDLSIPLEAERAHVAVIDPPRIADDAVHMAMGDD